MISAGVIEPNQIQEHIGDRLRAIRRQSQFDRFRGWHGEHENQAVSFGFSLNQLLAFKQQHFDLILFVVAVLTVARVLFVAQALSG